MAFEKAKQALEKASLSDRILCFEVSSATVELAARAAGTTEGQIAKSLTFWTDQTPAVIVCAGDAKISNSKFKAAFHTKAKMLSKDEVSMYIGHDVGGVCPFGINPGVPVYLDVSLRRFDTVYPACGNDRSAVKLTVDELERASAPTGWVDVCTVPED